MSVVKFPNKRDELLEELVETIQTILHNYHNSTKIKVLAVAYSRVVGESIQDVDVAMDYLKDAIEEEWTE